MMKRNSVKTNFRPGSLHDTRSPRSVLLRMAADQERADRIKALKSDRPDLTWRRIADYVGVSERAAADWARKGGMEYDNAKKLAKLLEVDVDYIWRGPTTDTPSPFTAQDSTEDRLAQMEQQLAAHEKLLVQQNELLARQSQILERIETAIQERDDAATREAESARRLDEAVEYARATLRGDAPDQEPARRTRAKSGNR